MTPSEKLVYDLCSRSAFSLWSYASPRRPDGRELCDVLVVFEKHIIIFSVKEIALKDTKDPSVAAERWTRKAIDESIKQLSGAQRELNAMVKVVRQDGSDGISLPPIDARQVHLVAVAAGGNRRIPYSGGVKEAGYVHVIDEFALREILGELDTILDFARYLEAKESFRGTVLCSGGEEELLAIYLQRGRQLPDELHLLIAEEGCWAHLCKSPEFVARKAEDLVSRWWDETIETLIHNFELSDEGGPSLTEREILVRTMAAEDRFQRRILSSAIVNWLNQRSAGARTMVSPSGVAYVFCTYPRDYDRKTREANIALRCFVTRSPSVTGCPTVVGIATEIYDPSGFSLDAVYFHLPEWTDEDELKAQETREKFAILNNPTKKMRAFQEYPTAVQAIQQKRNKNAEKRKRRNGRK